MDLGKELKAIEPVIRSSPLRGFEYVRGYGVFALPFDSGHVLALRVFPENDFAPYSTIWHRSPEGHWAIYVDGPRIDTACPRYYGAATRHVAQAKISLKWTGPMDLSIDMDIPKLQWNISMTTTSLVRVMNAISATIPESLWRAPLMLRAFEQFGGSLFDLGKVTLSGIAPNGHFSILMPTKMFPIASSEARLEGQDLGKPVRSPDNPSIGSLRLPARGIFAVGRGYFKIQDPYEYRRTVAELHPTAG
jgi:hypothetical protein